MTSINREIKLITGVERRRRWSIQEKQTIINQTYQPGTSVSLVARQHGISPCQLFAWRRLMEKGALQGISSEEELVPKSVVKELQKRVAELERLVGKKTLEIEILQEAVKVIQEKKHMLLRSWPKTGGSP